MSGEAQSRTEIVVPAPQVALVDAMAALGKPMVILLRNGRALALEGNVKNASLEDVLRQSDFITLHCPLMDSTRQIINKERIALMKPTAYIVNTSRGALIKEDDLIEALQQGRLAGAALDVQDPEPPALDNPLFAMDNVIMTPHIGWRRYESRQRLVDLVAENIKAFIDGKAFNVVNK